MERGRDATAGNLPVERKIHPGFRPCELFIGGLHAVFRKAFSHFNIRKETSATRSCSVSEPEAWQVFYAMIEKDVHLTGVEKDPVVIHLAKNIFTLTKNLSLHIEDAGDFVENCDKKFDLVVVDIFVGADFPEKFREEKFLAGLGRLLSPGGIS